MVNLEMNRWRVIKALFLCFESVKSYWRFCVMNLTPYSYFYLLVTILQIGCCSKAFFFFWPLKLYSAQRRLLPILFIILIRQSFSFYIRHPSTTPLSRSSSSNLFKGWGRRSSTTDDPSALPDELICFIADIIDF